MRDFFGYNVHYVMNVTDIDDKIILKARYDYLLKTFEDHHASTGLSQELLGIIKEAWSVYFRKGLKKLAPKAPPEEPQDPEDDAAWEEISRRIVQDSLWLQKASETEPKTTMWYEALVSYFAYKILISSCNRV